MLYGANLFVPLPFFVLPCLQSLVLVLVQVLVLFLQHAAIVPHPHATPPLAQPPPNLFFFAVFLRVSDIVGSALVARTVLVANSTALQRGLMEKKSGHKGGWGLEAGGSRVGGAGWRCRVLLSANSNFATILPNLFSFAACFSFLLSAL